MSGSDYAYKFRYWLTAGRMPLTKALILSNAVTFLLMALGGMLLIRDYLAFNSAMAIVQPWTIVTHPVVGDYGLGPNGIIGLLFAGYWLWFAGGSLERAWGTRTFAVYFFTMSGLSAGGLLLGELLTGAVTSAAGLWLPLAGVTVAFAMLNPEEQILFFFIIPLKLKYLALLDVVIVLVSFWPVHPIVGVTALAGCAYSYWYVRGGRLFDWRGRRPERPPVVRVHRRSFLSRLNLFTRLRERRERKKLRDLFNKSGME